MSVGFEVIAGSDGYWSNEETAEALPGSEPFNL
jgi:hypothetical protein